MAKKQMDVCVIDRSKWARGNKYVSLGDATLYTNKKAMCCLGFYSRQVLGRTIADIRDFELPSDKWLDDSGREKVALNVFGYMANMNDAEAMPEREREKAIRTAFREVLNCDVKFVGRNPRQ